MLCLHLQVYPLLDPGMKSVLPPHSFFTCSSDDTIRIWNLDPHMAETETYKTNIYSHVSHLTGIIQIVR